MAILNIGKYRNREANPRPDLILLDLNMPRKDGRQALAEIKSDPGYRHIPIVEFTTSSNPDDMDWCYKLGADSFITKPGTFESLNHTLNSMMQYWLVTAESPLESV